MKCPKHTTGGGPCYCGQFPKNPFITGHHNGHDLQTFDVEGRLASVKRFDACQCYAALEIEGLQKAVAVAVKRRLKQLERKA